MPGPKLNERPVLRGRQSGRTRPARSPGASAKAVARYVRVSPYKVRQVLDLVRGHHVERAEEILRFCERDAATLVSKVLASAVANAEHNEQVVSDELFVSACFADEGPTLKRWRPRARGRATRIRKRTCHVTVIVSRLPESELARRRAQRPAAVSERRRRRGGQDEPGRARRRGRAAEAAPEEDVSPATGDAGAEPDTTTTDAVIDEPTGDETGPELQTEQPAERATGEAAADDTAEESTAGGGAGAPAATEEGGVGAPHGSGEAAREED